MPIWRRQSDPPVVPDRFTADALTFLDALYRTAVRLTRDRDAAQDLVQDTYLKAFRARRRFTPGSNLKAWLYTILHNTWRNQRRGQAAARVEADSEAVERLVDQGADATAAADSPEARLLEAVLSDDLRVALEGLPASYRETVWLRDVEELTYQEISAVLDVPIGTVMSRLSRGRRQLYRALVAAGRNRRDKDAS